MADDQDTSSAGGMPGVSESPVVDDRPWTPERSRRVRLGWTVAWGLLAVLGWLLAKLLFLPYYFGLFFFLIAGLLAGAAAFRICLPARPIGSRSLALGTCFVAFLATSVTVVWEYEHIGWTLGERQFPETSNAASRANRPFDEVRRLIRCAFHEKLEADYPPGGVLGYVRWACDTGEMTLSVAGETDAVAISQSGWAWPVRTLAAFLLFAAGLWSAVESLRSASPVTNILAPGEEVMEDDE